jgi:ABC-type amino acid transport substrate-binding protein
MAAAAQAGPVLDKVKSRNSVRVCIWPDYYGVTFRNRRTHRLSGIDIDLSAELGKDLHAKVEYVESSFPTLVYDLKTDRCDVGMFAIGMMRERMDHLKFTRPYLASDLYGITTKSNPVVREWADIDKPGVLVGVQAGTFMGPVMAQLLQHAKVVTVTPPATRERELEGGRVDVFMTDYPYSRRLLDNADWARLVAPPKPVHVLPYAYAVKPGDDAWLQTMDDFVARIQRDGRLDSAARRNGLSEIVIR